MQRTLTKSLRRQGNRSLIWEATLRRCWYCGVLVSKDEFVLDHQLPSSHGGLNGAPNQVASCKGCDKLKGDRDLEEFRAFTKVVLFYGEILAERKRGRRTDMDRDTAKERFYSQALQRKVLELMEIFEPGESLKWGAKTPGDLIGYAACHLALEYERVTGHPVIELLNEAGACTNADLEMPAKPAAVQPIAAAPAADDALPLS